jgi:hypothetical protein
MRVLRLTLRFVFAVLWTLLAATMAIVDAVMVCLLWLVAPRACLAVWLLRRR